MKILSVECSAGPASAAIIEDGRVLSSAFVNVKLTHSQTLLPMIKSVLDSSLISMSDIGGIAVAVGPGSFTGIRIGIGAVKGLAAPASLPCAAVSTLRGMAEAFRQTDCIVCAVMDARCDQVYNALFRISKGVVERLCPDRALMCAELSDELKGIKEDKIIITGDGAELFYPYVQELPGVEKAGEAARHQNAVFLGLAAEEAFRKGDTVPPELLLPFYLRPPQAERELSLKKKKVNDKL